MTDDVGGKSALSEQLGPLPEPLHECPDCWRGFDTKLFTADQLRAYAAAAVAAERERCAKTCERISQQYKDAPGSHALERAANAIRIGA